MTFQNYSFKAELGLMKFKICHNFQGPIQILPVRTHCFLPTGLPLSPVNDVPLVEVVKAIEHLA